MIDRKPAAIVPCLGVANVIIAVNVAREDPLLTAVHGDGYHGVVGLDGVRREPESRAASGDTVEFRRSLNLLDYQARHIALLLGKSVLTEEPRHVET